MGAGKRLLILLLAALALPAAAVPSHQLCRLDQLTLCRHELPSNWQQVLTQLWPGELEQSVSQALAGQGGVTLLSEQDALILLDPQSLQRQHVILLGNQLIERPPLRNFRSTYYHEIGHVATRHSPWLEQLRQPLWPHHWAEEVLADLYLFWHLLREGAEAEELWMQVHLRNISLIQARPDWTHWTTPVTAPLLCDFKRLEFLAERPLEPFLDAVLSGSQDWPLSAYRRLGQRQFALTPPSVAQPYLAQPHRAHWAALLQPTFQWMGVDLERYYGQQHLPVAASVCSVINE
ncbi:hypothetical protein [Ferrimonas marina]|uniref:Peptidase MA superfamily protein n=1 Tax=Ferrimonas marina TaxID=299255 RepID=A0A1M5X2J1_9GAMM|nr:hypothetical protein [Ferrimonas marina]SHH93433.1 hypothetical protein SAMN02745129_3135 [Ferrimonas marina]